MRFSIVIPAYNEADYIAKTLTAALSQDFDKNEFEVLVIDNASSDKTGDIARSFANTRVIREEKKGVQFARERGRKEARGEILAYLDADCVPSVNWLSRSNKYFSDPRIAGLSGLYDFYDENYFFRFFSLWVQKIIFGLAHYIIQNILHRGGVMLGGNMIVSAASMDRIGGFNTAIRFYGDDTDTAKRLSRVGKVLYRSDILVGSSARRFRSDGVFFTFFRYVFHFLYTVFIRK